MTKVVCPLSKSARLTVLEKIRTADLVRMWNKWLHSDISPEFGAIKEIGFYHCADCDLKFFFPAVSGSEGFYEKLQTFDWYYRDSKSEYEYAKQFVKNSDLVLEIGCGKGAFAQQISPKNYIGLELCQKAIDAAHENGIDARKETIQYHAKNNLEKYNVVCAFQVLEHVADVRSFIDASLTCLKPKGLLIYSVPSADSFVYFLRNPLTNMPPHHNTWWSDKCLEKVAEIFGITVFDLKHEMLANRNKQLYAQTIIAASIENLLGIKPSLVTRSLKHRIIKKAASVGARFLRRGLADDRLLPHGHTVTAVYRK